jgi:transposase InsO family protein
VDRERILLRVVRHRRLFAENSRVARVDEQDRQSCHPRARSAAIHATAGKRRVTSRGLIHHSDAGSRYTALAFTEELAEAGIAGSIGTVGDALDNALMEP